MIEAAFAFTLACVGVLALVAAYGIWKASRDN